MSRLKELFEEAAAIEMGHLNNGLSYPCPGKVSIELVERGGRPVVLYVVGSEEDLKKLSPWVSLHGQVAATLNLSWDFEVRS